MTASGRKLVIPVSFTDTTLPIIHDDSVLPSDGALFLVDFMHSTDPSPPVGVPATGSTMWNVAWAQAAAAIGSGTSTTLKAQIASAGYSNPALAKLERSTKGGLHSITSQVSDPGSSAWEMKLADPIKTYILANPTHNYYASCWSMVTRPYLVGANQRDSLLEFANTTGVASNYRIMLALAFNQPAVGRAAANVNGPVIGNANATAWVGSAPASIGTFIASFGLGGYGGYNFTAPIRQAKASRILYRGYIEDLTVSGRTYTDVDTLDFAAYTRDVLTVGGRYYGDTTPTAPSSIP